jgi:hypothetical protein
VTRVTRRRNRQSGTVLIEFALSALLLFPLMIGVVILGLNLGRSVHVMQVCRDAGSMFVHGIDFAATGNQDVVVRLAQGMGMTRTGGSGVIFFSKVKFIPASDCAAIVGACNSDKYVVVQRLTIGNTVMSPLQSSRLGPAGSVTLDSHGNVANFLTDANAVSATFSSIMTLASGEYAYVSEAYFLSIDLTSLGAPAGDGVYARALF